MYWLVNWLEYFPNTLSTQLFVLFRSQCVWNGPAWGPATVCVADWTVEAKLRPVEACGGIPIHFGESSYVNFLHFFRLSFSSLTFTNFFPFCSLFSSYFYLFIDTFICTLLD